MSPSPAHVDEVQCLFHPGRCVDHIYRGKCCCGGQHPMQESRREIMALGGEKHPLPWQASTGLSLFQRHAIHIATPQAQAMMMTASSSWGKRSLEPCMEELWCAMVCQGTAKGWARSGLRVPKHSLWQESSSFGTEEHKHRSVLSHLLLFLGKLKE